MQGRHIDAPQALSVWRAIGLGAAALFCAHVVGLVLAATAGATAIPDAVRNALHGIAWHVVTFNLELLACVVAFGAAFGWLGWFSLRAFGVVPSRLRISGIVAGLTGAAFAHAVARRPALFEDLLWRKGGWRAELQVFLTETIGYRGVDGLLLLLGVATAVAAAYRWRRAALRLALAAGAVIGLVRAEKWWSHRSWSNEKPVVIMLGADSLRPDHLSSEGNPRATSPHIDALRAKGAFVEDFFVPIASTQPSWTTFMTGVYPHRHGVRDIFPRREQSFIRRPTVPRLLSEHGYDSVAVSDYAGDFFTRLEFGFKTVDAPPSTNLEMVADRESLERLPLALSLLTGSVGQRLFKVVQFLPVNADPEALTDRVETQLDELEQKGRPFFLAAFYSVTHLPFAPPMPDAADFTDPHYRGRSRYSYELQQLDDLQRLSDRPSDAEVVQVRALYDGAVRSFDREVGKLLARLDADGVTNRIVIIAGDHGEGLFEPGATTEHGKWFVGGTAANRTTFILSGPGVRPGNIGGLASGVDFAPTLLELLHIPAPPDLDGISLLSTPPPPDRTVFAETTTWLTGDSGRPPDTIGYPPFLELLEAEPGTHALVLKRRYADTVVTARIRAARRGPWELVYTPTTDGSKVALFNLLSDRYAQHDVASEHPELVEDLRGALLKWMAGDPIRWLDARGHLVARTER